MSGLFALKFEPDKLTPKLVSSKIKNLPKNNVKKVIIIGCTGEFMVEKSVAPSAWEGKDMTYFKRKEAVRTTQVYFNQEYCADLTTQVMDHVAKMLTDEGMEIVPQEVWQAHPVYQEMVKHMESYDEDKGTKYGLINQTVSTRTIKAPAYGLRLVPDDLIGMIKFSQLDTQQKGKILEDTGAQAFVRINMYVGYGAKWKPYLRTLDIFFDSGVKKYDMGGGKSMYSITGTDNLSIKDILEYQNSVIADKYFDTKLYGNAVLEMVDSVLKLYSPILKSAVSQYK
jgi:hypothetical protein